MYALGGNVRQGEAITAEGLATNTATEYLGDLLGNIVTRRMAPHGFASKLVESIVSNLGDGTTGSWADATKELREAKGNNYTTLDLMRRMVEKGAWSSFLPASAVVSHAVGKAQHNNEIVAAKKEQLQEVRRAIEQSSDTPAQQLARKHLDFTGAELAAALQSESTAPEGNGNGNNGSGSKPATEGAKPSATREARSDNQEQTVVASVEKPSKDTKDTTPVSGANSPSSASTPVPANHQRFYYVQQSGEAEISEAPLSSPERARLSQLSEYEGRGEVSSQEATELEGLQKD